MIYLQTNPNFNYHSLMENSHLKISVCHVPPYTLISFPLICFKINSYNERTLVTFAKLPNMAKAVETFFSEITFNRAKKSTTLASFFCAFDCDLLFCHFKMR